MRALPVLFALIACGPPSAPAPDPAPPIQPAPFINIPPPRAEPTVLLDPPKTLVGWEYEESTDAMTSEPIRMARVLSDERHQLPFPTGTTTSALVLRRHPRHGLSIVVKVSSGQLLCVECRIPVRFGDAAPSEWKAALPADGSTDALFLEPEEKFLAELKKAAVVRLELTFYGQGAHQFTYQTAGLRWE